MQKAGTVQIPTIKNRLDDDSHEGCFLYADFHVQGEVGSSSTIM